MPAWPGGPCPGCGEDMPQNMVRCRSCRTLLNDDLVVDSVEVPEFIPLPELDAMVDLQPAGYFVSCPKCQKELKVARKYVGEQVECKYCASPFRLIVGRPPFEHFQAFSQCPHCTQALRFDAKYLGQTVACRFCDGKLRLLD